MPKAKPTKSAISTFHFHERFPDAESARLYLESRLWPTGARCPVCGLPDRITARKAGYYRCNQCAEDFTVRTGTVMECCDTVRNRRRNLLGAGSAELRRLPRTSDVRQIIYCYGDGHPTILNGDTITDADRAALLRHLKRCQRCGHPQEWHTHSDHDCLFNHPQPCIPETAPFRCLGYDCMGEGFPGGTPETRCGCPDFAEP